MLDFLGLVGRDVVGFVLWLAGLLVGKEAPGLVALGLFITLLGAWVFFALEVRRKRGAVEWLTRLVASSPTGAEFSRTIDC